MTVSRRQFLHLSAAPSMFLHGRLIVATWAFVAYERR